MKKNIKIISILLFTSLLFITACGKKDEIKKVEPNQNVSSIKFYVPTDYQSRADLRGLLYTDNERKVFAKGDTSDYNTFYYIDMKKDSNNGQTLDDYINYINTNNLKEADVKFVKYNNEHLTVYAREGYGTRNSNVNIINYAYITEIDNFFYALTVSGPKDNQNEIETIAKESANSLQK